MEKAGFSSAFWRETKTRRRRREGRLTVLPIDDLPVGVVSVLRTERWVSDETFEHDGTVSGEKREVSKRELRKREGSQVDEKETTTDPRDHQSHSFEYPCWRKISGEICSDAKRETGERYRGQLESGTRRKRMEEIHGRNQEFRRYCKPGMRKRK